MAGTVFVEISLSQVWPFRGDPPLDGEGEGMFQAKRLRIALMIGVIAAVGLFSNPSRAATIDLTPTFPDLTLFSGSLSYTYTAICQNSSGTSIGSCGSGGRNTARWDLTYGLLTITGNTLTLNPDGSGPIGVTDVNGSAPNYSLTVILGFGAGGTALSTILATDPCSGTCSDSGAYSSALAAYGTTANVNFQSGTIVTGTPTSATAFGYAYPFGWGGQNRAGIFEFVFDNVGGDMGVVDDHGGIIASTTNLTHPLLTTSPPVETWDSNGVNFWKNNFSATVTVDTFVPVPAAVWLLGSGLLSLFGMRLARNNREVQGAKELTI
jgi:hypothetical protein